MATVENVDSFPGTEPDRVAASLDELLIEVAMDDKDDDVGDPEFSPSSISPRVTSDALNWSLRTMSHISLIMGCKDGLLD